MIGMVVALADMMQHGTSRNRRSSSTTTVPDELPLSVFPLLKVGRALQATQLYLPMAVEGAAERQLGVEAVAERGQLTVAEGAGEVDGKSVAR